MIWLMKLLKSWIPASWIIWVPDPLAQRAGTISWRNRVKLLAPFFFKIPICQRIFGASRNFRFLIPDLQFLDPGSLEISKFLTPLTMLNHQFYPKKRLSGSMDGSFSLLLGHRREIGDGLARLGRLWTGLVEHEFVGGSAGEAAAPRSLPGRWRKTRDGWKMEWKDS